MRTNNVQKARPNQVQPFFSDPSVFTSSRFIRPFSASPRCPSLVMWLLSQRYMVQWYLVPVLVAGKVSLSRNYRCTDECVVWLVLSSYNAFCTINYTLVTSHGQRSWCVYLLRFRRRLHWQGLKVFAVWAFDMMHTACIITAVWQSVIVNFNQPEKMDDIPS